MKKILITGKNSYIGNKLQEWLNKNPKSYDISKISVRTDIWKTQNFSKYDIVFHTAGIAHIKETKQNEYIYYKVNRDLAYEVAVKAKKDGVRQFIFLSSMSVYGIEKGIIEKDTPLKPSTAYGKSKLEAENLINSLNSDSFIVTILRPPIVYGKNCRGNYSRLSNFALRTIAFPRYNNKRSMIYIDNLSEFVKQLIDNSSEGVYFPQNSDYVNVSNIVNLIAKAHGKKVKLTKIFNPFLKSLNISIINKIFGDLVYEMSMSEYKNDYRIYNLEKSVLETEK